MLPQLYNPTGAEILGVTASAKRRHPHMATRIDKAQAILTAGLQLEPVAWEVRNVARWRIASQSHGGAYIVNGQCCPCQDSRAPHVGHERRCKHSIAVNFYTKILTNHFNADVRARGIDLGILPDATFNAYAKGMGHVHVRRLGTAYVFCDAASMVRYSIWLAAQQPVAVEWPMASKATVAA
jgi:hypothetical protein